MNAFILLISTILFVVLLLPPLLKAVAKGKLLVYFIEDDGYLNSKLKKPMFNNEYIVDGEGAYEIMPGGDFIGLTAFPKGFIPAFFQTLVPYTIYQRDNPVPQPIRNPVIKDLTSKEVKLGLEPHFLTGLARHSQEGIKESRLQKSAPALTLIMVGLILILILVVYSRVGSLENLIKLIGAS